MLDSLLLIRIISKQLINYRRGVKTMTVTQNIMNAVKSVDENSKLVIAAIVSAVAQTQKNNKEKQTQKGDKNDRHAR